MDFDGIVLGMVVYLNSRGHPMTVTEITQDSELVECTWQTDDGTLQVEIFHPEALSE